MERLPDDSPRVLIRFIRNGRRRTSGRAVRASRRKGRGRRAWGARFGRWDGAPGTGRTGEGGPEWGGLVAGFVLRPLRPPPETFNGLSEDRGAESPLGASVGSAPVPLPERPLAPGSVNNANVFRYVPTTHNRNQKQSHRVG